MSNNQQIGNIAETVCWEGALDKSMMIYDNICGLAALRAIVATQQTGGVAVWVDTRHQLNLVRATALGVDVNKLLVSQPDNGEQCVDVMDALVRSGQCALIVLDSTAALDYGEPELNARLRSRTLRKLRENADKNRTEIIFL